MLIAVDQVQRGLNAAMTAVARKLGVVQKRWVAHPDRYTCAYCLARNAEGWVSFDTAYEKGFTAPPAHARCRCTMSYRVSLSAGKKLAGARRFVDLPGQEWWWPEDSYPSGPAMGGGGPMHTAHNAEGIQEYIPGGVPGMTAGDEPPRWPGNEAPAVVTPSEPTVSAGRGNVQTRGGGTVSGPYRDFSGETHNDAPETQTRPCGPVSAA